jgi:REP element-mobilizing transposase RayT
MEEVKQGYQSLSHSKWDCKYHVVFIPKRRRKALFGKVGRHLGKIFHALAQQKECQIIEGHMMPDHIFIAIPRRSPCHIGDWFPKRKRANSKFRDKGAL